MKERLTGAIILVALIVLLVPELLTGPIRSAPRAMASSAGEPPLRSYTINLGDEAHSKPAEPQAAQAASPAPVPLPAPPAAATQDDSAAAAPSAPDTQVAAPAPLPATAPAPALTTPHPKSESTPARAARAPAATAAAAPVPEAAAASGAWMVQLGSFASRANADRFAQKLKGQGFAASVSRGGSGRHLYRVRVGPVHDHGAALQLQTKLQAAGHGGAIVPK